MAETPRRSRRALLVTFLVGLPLSAIFLWLSLRGADLHEVGQSLRDARPLPLVGSVALLALMYWLQALRWRRLARASLSRSRVYGMLLGALAVNNVVPGRFGDILRAGWMARATRTPAGRGLASVVLDRGCDLIVLAGFLFLCLPLVAHDGWLDRLAVGAALAVVGFLVVLLGARLYVRRRPPKDGSNRRLVRRVARETVEALSEPTSPSEIARAVALSVGAWLAWSGAAMLCASAIDIELAPVEAMFLAGVVNLGVAIPSSPGFVGTYHWLVLSTLALYGVEQDAGLAFAVLYQACWYIPTTLVGSAIVLATPRSERSSRRVTGRDEEQAPQPA